MSTIIIIGNHPNSINPAIEVGTDPRDNAWIKANKMLVLQAVLEAIDNLPESSS